MSRGSFLGSIVDRRAYLRWDVRARAVVLHRIVPAINSVRPPDSVLLITEPPAAGTPDMVSFDGDKHSVFSLHFWGHTIYDWSTYKILFYNRDIYFRHWPPNNGNNCPRNFGNQK